MKADHQSRSHHLVSVLGALLVCSPVAQAQQSLSPSAAFVQAGSGDQAREASVGVTWDWSLERAFGSGVVTGYWEASLSRWTYPRSHDEDRPSWLGQMGAIPVFRYRPDSGSSPWFAEAGIGLTLMSRIYRTDEKRFSTRFNFGDHIAIGRNFGAAQEQEIALRFEHFSNGGIKHPNPGENFVQLRYTFRFK